MNIIRVILIGDRAMLTINTASNSLCTIRKTFKLLDERNVFVDTEELAKSNFHEMANKYRSIILPISNGVPVKDYNIDLFESVSASRIAITPTDTVEDAVGKLRLEVLDYLPPNIVLEYEHSRYHVNPHNTFDIKGVKTGVHPDHMIDPAEATDLICVMRDTPLTPPTFLWTVGNYFYYSNRLAGNVFYLSNANVYSRKLGKSLVLGALDISNLRTSYPKGFDEVAIEEDSLVFTLPNDYQDGVVLFIAGRPFFNIKDSHDIVVSNGKVKIPLSKLNLSINYLGQWMEDFDVKVETIQDILLHETSFWIAYSGELYLEYDEFFNISKDSFHIQSEPLAYQGELLLDSDDCVVPFLTARYPSTNEQLYLVESYWPKKQNHLSKANYLIEKGILHDTVEALKSIGVGLYRENKSNVFGMVKLCSLTKITYSGEEDAPTTNVSTEIL